MKTINDNKTGDKSGSKSYFFQVVVKFWDEVSSPGDSQKGNFDSFALGQIQKTIPEIDISRLFTSLSFDEITGLVEKARCLDTKYYPPDFSTYYVIRCPSEADARLILQNVLTDKSVESAYIVNDSTPPLDIINDNETLGTIQGYLSPAPYGVNAEYAWSIKGGSGEGGVKFIDIEQGWILDHESISASTLPCTGLNYDFYDHGTAVLGIILMQNDDRIGRGITPKVKGFVVSQWRTNGFLNNPDAIMVALAQLEFGDVILVQAQVRDLSLRKSLWPVETHIANFDVIRLATALGITVIEPAANGSVYFNFSNDLDQFELNGKKVLNRSDPGFRDSGAIMVAAASAELPHRRKSTSNYGSRVDCYGWGENVYTAGSYPEPSGEANDRYTKNFGGTSSASAIIAGVVISVQSISEANYNCRLTPAQIRKILSSELYGTPSANGHSIDKIGVMPDLKKIIGTALF